MARKIRSDAVLLNLEEVDQEKIYTWLKNGVSYTRAKSQIKDELGINTSNAALSAFWEYWSDKDSKERILRNVTAANDVVDNVAGNVELLSQATMAALYQSTFEVIQSGGDQKAVKDMMTIILKSRALDQAEETLQLRIREFEQKIADVQKDLSAAKADGGMTVEAIEQMEAQLNML